MTAFEWAVQAGESAGVRLETAGGIPTWEAFPSLRHQRAVDRIRATIRRSVTIPAASECACIHVADVSIRFPEGSLKRPDISIFCKEPREQIEAVTMLPEAVIEIISPGYEGKDLAVGIPFYLRMGIKDVIVFDPETGRVRHLKPGESEDAYPSPVTLTLTCGCEVVV